MDTTTQNNSLLTNVILKKYHTSIKTKPITPASGDHPHFSKLNVTISKNPQTKKNGIATSNNRKIRIIDITLDYIPK